MVEVGPWGGGLLFGPVFIVQFSFGLVRTPLGGSGGDTPPKPQPLSSTLFNLVSKVSLPKVLPPLAGDMMGGLDASAGPGG